MGKHFALALQLPFYRSEQQKQKNRTVAVAALQQRSATLGIALAAAGIGLLFVYLFQVNSFATKGYEIKKIQDQISSLQLDQQHLQIQAAQLQSIQRIQTAPQTLNMVPVTTIGYIQTASLSQR